MLLVLTLSKASTAAPGEKLYLPMIYYNSSVETVIGIEMSSLSAARGLDLMLTSGTRWVRRNALLWSEIEPVEGAGYRWDGVETALLETEMIVASAGKLQLILVVRSSPNWAVAPYSAECGPVNSSKRVAFARFMAAAVARYSVPPYNVRYWEIGNEPDATLIADDFVYGCWGIEGDPYFGGRQYGTTLKAVYQAMNKTNPAIKVLNGGLLLDKPYDPRNPATTPGRFFEGMLEAGAGNSFDIISFHTYNYYAANDQPFGPSTDWRISYLTDLLRRYSIPPKPLMRTETALLCVEVTPECRWAQADYVARTFVYTLRDGLLANIWYVYDNDSYHNTGMIEQSDVFVPRPAYFAYRHTARLLNTAQYIGSEVGLPPNVNAHRLQRGTTTILAYWVDAELSVPFSIPVPVGSRVSCTDRDGGALVCPINDGQISLTATRSPAFVVVN